MNKNIFITCEGNNWFSRNKDLLTNYQENKDIILQNFDITKYNNMNILEVGCSNGWRLNELYNINNTNNYYGF